MIIEIIDQLPFELSLYEKKDSHTNNILPKYQGRFRKKFSFQHSSTSNA